MQRWKIVTPFVLASILAIAFFSGGARVPMDGDTTSDLALEEQENETGLDQKEGGFGADIDLGDGIVLKVSDPAAFKAKDPEALGVEGLPQIMDITISNNGSETLDISSFSIIQSAFDGDETQSCSDVFEADSGVVGAPEDPMIPTGKSATFKWAIVCPTTKGDKLHLTFSVTGNEEVTLDSTVK
jgi:hypothetical protein